MTTLEQLIADIESAGNKYALRFEPHVYQRTQEGNRYSPMVNLARGRNKCSLETARVIIATSFGQFQIMGFNLYDPNGINYPDCVGVYLNDDMVQAATFRAFCQKRSIYFTVDDLRDPAFALRFAKIYNGADAYAQKIAQRLAVA